jgi:hypothetical protein
MVDKIVYLLQGTGTELDNLNALLEDGWKVVQMSVTMEEECAGCFFWIRKETNVLS